MTINNTAKQQYMQFLTDSGSLKPEEVIKIQIQNVTRELAKLLGIIEGGQNLFESNPQELEFLNLAEIRRIKESGIRYLDTLIKNAKQIGIQLQ